MKTLRSLRLPVVAVLLAGLVSPGVAADKNPPMTATNTIVNPEYQRTKLADGSFQKETYAFGQGEFSAGRFKDPSIEQLKFNDLARVLADALARKGYVASRNSADTQLLIVVHWGTTIPFQDGASRANMTQLASAMARTADTPILATPTASGAPPAEAPTGVRSAQESELTSMLMMQDQFDRMRDRANDRNARLLGYAPELERFDGAIFGPLRQVRADLVDEIEDDRYYVALIAMDFQQLWKKKEKRILWITRFSIRAHGNRFDEQIANMARTASAHFGESTNALIHARRAEKIEIGPAEVIRYEETK